MAEKGVLIVATGDKLYGEYAFNLALSLRANEQHIPIAVITDGGALASLSEGQRAYFDKIIMLPRSAYEIDGKLHHFYIKTLLYDLTPFEHTLYLDADTCWIPYRRPSWLIGELDYFDFTCANGGYYDFKDGSATTTGGYLFWGELDKIQAHFKLSGRIPQYNSTIMFFKKSVAAKTIFDKAKSVYNDKHAPRKMNSWGIADEYCFNVASALTGIMPHTWNYQPIYIHFLENLKSEKEILQDFWGLTNCGNNTHPSIVSMYHNLLDRYTKKMGLPHFYHRNKKDVIADRKFM